MKYGGRKDLPSLAFSHNLPPSVYLITFSLVERHINWQMASDKSYQVRSNCMISVTVDHVHAFIHMSLNVLDVNEP